MKKNVLVFPCGSEIGLEIYKSLSFSTHFSIYGGSSVDDHGKYVYENYVGGLPFIDDEDFEMKMNETIEQYQIDYIIPAHDSAVLRIAQLKAANALKCEVISSPLETCMTARSKALTYKRLKGVIPTPKLYEAKKLSEDLLPVFLKPDVGQGSKGTFFAQNLESVNFNCSKDPSLLILEYLPGKEYTIDCFTNRDGKLLFCQGRERKRISNGISVSSSEAVDERFKVLAERINDTLVFRGVWFFQVKENNSQELVLLEIAPRVAGTMGLVRCQGVNLPLLSLFDAEGYELDIVKNTYALTIDRALENKYKHSIEYRHVYIDYDDLIIFEGKVNPQVMAFIYQCLNDKIAVHLLTKHSGDLEKSLKQHHLLGVFDEVIWIRDDTPKYEYIHHDNAIFVDDSHAERIEVYQKHGIPIFDAHSLEALIR